MATIAPADHGAQMDAIYGIQRHFYDLTRKYYLLGRDRLIRDLAMSSEDTALEIGCGTGRNLALATRRYPKARLHGLDISQEMLKSAQRKLGKPVTTGRIRLARADATAFEAAALFGRGTFDRVWFSYTLSMIPDWLAALDQAVACVAPGGSLHIVDFGQQRGLPRWFRAMLHAWLARFHVTPRNGLLEACHQIATEQGWTIEVARPYRDYAWSITLIRP
jgi:S-adenosylmethionine-diacylgycerolhomoserine-N-methlytransferase